MIKHRRLLAGLAGFLAVILFLGADVRVQAREEDELDSLNVGVASILDPGALAMAGKNSDVLNTQYKTIGYGGADSDSGEDKKEPGENLAMANVQNAVNVRASADESSERVGMLYRDCGGRILERRNGWTKLRSGDLTGWVKDDYLVFDDQAKALANEVGNLIVTIDADALRVRKEPSKEAGTYGYIAQDELDVVDVVDENWISVEYDGKTGYVSSEFVNLDFHIDAGETIQAIQAREKAEAEAKAKRIANYGAMAADADDTRLLAALIQCEAGSEPYEGQVAVGAVVMNRVRSGGYPNTIQGVIYASGQFTPAMNGKVNRVYEGRIYESCMKAAEEALSGVSNVGTATHFRRVGNHDGQIINNHVFW